MFDIRRLRRGPDTFEVHYRDPLALTDLRESILRLAALATPGGPTMILVTFQNEDGILDLGTELGSDDATMLSHSTREAFRLIGPGRGAVCLRGDYAFGIARLYGTHLELTTGREFGAFRELAEARAWLDLPPAPEGS